MSRSALSVLIVAVVALYLCEVVESQESCGPNKFWDDCGTACPRTCKLPNLQRCTKQCVAGCRCQLGLVLQDDGSCIEPSQCP